MRDVSDRADAAAQEVRGQLAERSRVESAMAEKLAALEMALSLGWRMRRMTEREAPRDRLRLFRADFERDRCLDLLDLRFAGVFTRLR